MAYRFSNELAVGTFYLLGTIFAAMAGTAVTAFASRSGGVVQKLCNVIVGVDELFRETGTFSLWFIKD